MTSAQRQVIINRIEAIESLDVVEQLHKQFPNDPDLATVQIGNYFADELVAYLQRALKQLKAEMSVENARFLPLSQTFNNEFSSVNLDADLANIFSYIQQQNFTHVAIHLDRIIYYQVINGFWDKSASRRSKAVLEYEKAFESVKAVEKKLALFIEQGKASIDALDAATKSVDAFFATKRTEFATLTANQQTSNTIVSELQAALTNAKVTETNILNIQTNFDEKLKEATKQKGDEQKAFELLHDDLSLQTQSLKNFLHNAEESLNRMNADEKVIADTLTEITRKKDEAIKLVGFMADVSMGHSFDTRQKELKKSKNTWMWITAVAVILSFAWLVLPAIFPQLVTQYADHWLNLLAYLGKSAIVFIVLGFVIRQYAKERALQEEYAFKTAMALTVGSYADQIGAEEDEEKRKLIIDTVQKLFAQPRIHPEPGVSPFALRRSSVEKITSGVVNGLNGVLSKK